MTIANTKVLAKVVAVFAVAALALSAFALSASAQGTTPACTNFSHDLTVGAQGAHVTVLQNFLINKGFTIAAGATGYFGGQTQAALAQYQASVNITPAVGYFGPITRAKVTADCATVGGGTGDDDDDDATDDDDDMELEGGAGNLDDADFISSLNNEEVGEGSEEVEVAGLELSADSNSDLGLTAARVMLENDAAATGSDDLDDYAESISLWFNGEELDTVDVDDIDEDDGEWEHTFTIDWEDAIIRADESGELVLAVTALENIDTSDLNSNDWNVSFEMVRYVDAQGAVISEESEGDIGSETRPFEFATFVSANDVELTLDESDDTPEADTVEVDESGGDEVLLLVGELEAEGADIEIGEMVVIIDTNATSTTAVRTREIATEYILTIDGDEVDSVDSDEETASTTVASSGNASSTYTFDLDEYEVEEGETVEFEIWAVIDEIEDLYEGTGITATVQSTGLDDVEAGGEDLSDSDISGTASGEEITVASEGLAITYDDDASGASASDNVGTFEFVLDVTAFGEDVTLANADFNYTVYKDGTPTTTGSLTISDILTSNDFDEESSETFEINEGEDGTMTFTVYVSINDATAAGVYRVELDTVDDSDPVTIDESEQTFISYTS